VDLVVDLAEEALEGGLLRHAGPQAATAYLAIFALIFSDRYDAARVALDTARDEARRRGSVVGYATASAIRSHLHYRMGALADAEADAREALSGAASIPAMVLPARAFLADVLIERDELSEAAHLVDGVELHPEASGVFTHVLHSRARLRLCEGRAEESLQEALDCGRRLATSTVNPGAVPWRSAAAEALRSLGRFDEALRLAEEEVELARRHSAPRAVGLALLTAGRCKQGEQPTELLEGAVSVLGRSAARLEHARALVALGVALRHARRPREAREPLLQGLDAAHRCGATALAREARAELVVAGARPRREVLSGFEALTASERRVAQMAAEGLTNPEIAQALFVTRKTVEKHLSGAYTKLRIGSRDELPTALADRG